jgi:hypothetical protein
VVAVAIEWAPPAGSPLTALTCQVFGVGTSRGASEDRGPMTVPEAGLAVLYLVDPNRDLDPRNTAGIWYGSWDLGVTIRITIGVSVAFLGRVDAISHTLHPAVPGYEGVPIARVAVVDWVGSMSRVNVGGPFPAATSVSRINRLVQLAGSIGLTQAGSPFVNVQAGSLVNDAWSDALAVTQNELGSIEFIGASATVRTRANVWTTSTPALHLGCDDPDSSAELVLDSLDLTTETSTIRNSVSAARAGGTVRPTALDATSRDKYGLRTTQRNDLILTTDADVDAWAAFVLLHAKTPARALRSAVVTVTTSAAIQLIETVPLFQGRVHVYQDHYGQPIDVRMRLLGVSWDVDEQARATATLVLGQE